ncbi:MAG: glycosyltransferase, partial [Mangrovicoccus sp.]
QPSRPAGHRFRIAWLKSQKRFEEAEDCIKFFSAACPDEGDLTREMAELAAASNDPKRVVEILVDFQNKGALDYKTQIVLADAYMALADETALSHMLARLPGDCVDADASILKARILIALGLNMDAMPPLKNALHQNPNDQHLWALYIQSMTDLGQAREVIAEVAKLDSTVLQRPAIRLRIAGAYWAIGEYDEALDALGQAENGPILRQITNYTSQLGRLDLAEQAISNWRNGTENDSVIGHFAQAMICRNVMDFAGCLDHTEAAIELAPDRAGLFTLMGHSLMCLSRPGEALEAFEKAYLLDRASGAPKIVHKYGIFSEILNELRLEPEMTTQLEAIAAQAPKNQIQSFSDLLRKYRDNSAAALSLLISLRRAGHFEVSDLVPTGDMRNIPKVIYQYWETGEPPQDLSAAMKKLHQCHSDFDIKLYDCSTARQFIKRLGEPNLLRAFNMSEHAAERADLLRLVLLREYGGIYLDCDDICLGYLPDIIPSDAEFVTYQ